MRSFNTTGPVVAKDHYCLPPLSRLDLDEVLWLIDQNKYFVLHAPRQTGKTSCLLALTAHLNASGKYRALYANVEMGQSARENVADAMRAVLYQIGSRSRTYLGDPLILDRMDAILHQAGPHNALNAILSEWAAADPRPAILMLDEIDALVGDTLISVLRQVRGGYDERPNGFPQSIILCGVRDVRDYRIHASSEKSVITGGSAFNIKAKSLRLGDFSREEMERLYAQHTEETGQVFEPEALNVAWELSCGQPWVVNALAYEACFEMKDGRDRTRPVTSERIQQASENLILRRETHLDQLGDKLQEDRVRRVMEPLIAGEELERRASEDDIQYVLDLGLIRRGPAGLDVANGIYREVIPRQLTAVAQIGLESLFQPAWYKLLDGRLDMDGLLTAFQQFYRENSDYWLEGLPYHEAAPQLLLQAFLQRIVNGGGQIHREYGLGRGRTDLLVVWPVPTKSSGIDQPTVQKTVLELKVIGGPRWKKSVETTTRLALEQTAAYMDRCGTRAGHLVMFDRDPDKTWDEKVWRRDEIVNGLSITLWGL